MPPPISSVRHPRTVAGPIAPLDISTHHRRMMSDRRTADADVLPALDDRRDRQIAAEMSRRAKKGKGKST